MGLVTELLGLRKVGFGLGFVAFLFVGYSSKIIGHGEVRIKANSFVKANNGLIIFANLCVEFKRRAESKSAIALAYSCV